MVPPDSHRVSRVPRYSGYCYRYICLLVRDFHPLWYNFPVRFQFIYITNVAVLQPQNCLNNLGLGFSPFARHYLGNHYCFLFLRVLRCFSSPGLPSLRNIPLGMGCPIRISTDNKLFAPPRSFSQLVTSFIASRSQGILHTLLFTFYYSSYLYALDSLIFC